MGHPGEVDGQPRGEWEEPMIESKSQVEVVWHRQADGLGGLEASQGRPGRRQASTRNRLRGSSGT